ncbi:MAG: hypothetical protein IKN88_06070 [Bacteroidales bacterium]|nr:hypothetical protein [Bacteroidales bacterium]
MTVVVDNIQKAAKVLENSLGIDYEVIDATPMKVKDLAAEIGQRNNTALMDGEVAEFFSKEEYESHPGEYYKVVRNIRNDNFSRLYALVNRYRLVNGKKIGERTSFINVGGMVRTHFDVGGQTPDANGKIIGARRSLILGDFNVRLNSYASPWEMLTQFLAGKKVKAARSTDKLWFQRFEGGKPVPNEYREQNYLIYDFVE